MFVYYVCSAMFVLLLSVLLFYLSLLYSLSHFLYHLDILKPVSDSQTLKLFHAFPGRTFRILKTSGHSILAEGNQLQPEFL